MRPFFYGLHSCRLPPIISHSDCVLVEAQVILIRGQRFKMSALKRALGLRPVGKHGLFSKTVKMLSAAQYIESSPPICNYHCGEPVPA